MALDRQIARLAKLLVDAEAITFDEAQARLRALTLEIVVGPGATSAAAHAAILTAVCVGSRTFVGGVRVIGAVDQALNSAAPFAADTLAGAALEAGASDFAGPPAQRIVIGAPSPCAGGAVIAPWWRGWRAGVAAGDTVSDDGANPLAGIAAGALAVGVAFETARGCLEDPSPTVDLWPTSEGPAAPDFADVFLPGAIWLLGLGNLGQAFLWALASLPYSDPSAVEVVLQDADKVSAENWATSVLVKGETWGARKTQVGEAWAAAKGFDVRRVDRRLLPGDRLDDGDPRVALCGVDKIEAREWLAKTGFECIVDAGLGRRASDFDRYRVTVFDGARWIDQHFAGQPEHPAGDAVPDNDAYRRLEAEVGRCGAAEIAGASIAAPFVSAVAAATALSRLIAIASGCACPSNEVRRLRDAKPRTGPLIQVDARGVRHAGRPALARQAPHPPGRTP